MSLYRQQGGRSWRWIGAATLLALLVGSGVGFALGRSSAPEPSLSEIVAEVRAEVQPAIDGISLVPDHYAQSVRGGEVLEPTQYEGARQQVMAAQDALAAAAADLNILSTERLSVAEARLRELARAVERRKAAGRVAEIADQAEAAVSRAAGDGGR
jgi:hypothetical protein